MNPLLVILSYAKANDMVARHWPWYLKADCDILAVGRENSICNFPMERRIGHIRIGKDSYVNGDNLIKYHLGALEHCLTEPNIRQNKYTHFYLTEPDAIFLKEPPLVGEGLRGTLSGGHSIGFHGSRFFHGPWIFDIATAISVVFYGHRMVNAGLIELGFPDRFYGLLCDLYTDVKFYPLSNTYSQNRIDRPEFVQQARQAIEDGCWYIHGLKTQDELHAVTNGLIH